MPIHHNTVKKATSHGLTLAVEDGKVVVHDSSGGILATAVDPKDALDLAILELHPKTPKAPRKARKVKAKVSDDEGLEDAEDEGEDDDKSIVKSKYRGRYRPHKMTCGDAIARRVREEFMTKEDPDTGRAMLDWSRFKQFAKQNGCWQSKYDHVNHGIARMSVVNRLRKMARAKVTIVWG